MAPFRYRADHIPTREIVARDALLLLSLLIQLLLVLVLFIVVISIAGVGSETRSKRLQMRLQRRRPRSSVASLYLLLGRIAEQPEPRRGSVLVDLLARTRRVSVHLHSFRLRRTIGQISYARIAFPLPLLRRRPSS